MKTLHIIKPIGNILKHYGLVCAVSAGLGAGNALAAPANDDFANAIELVGDTGTQTGTDNADATIETGEPDPGTGATNTVWFKWTCSNDGLFTISTTGSTTAVPDEWDAVLGMYTGTAVNDLAPLPGTPQDGGYDETMTVAVTAGTTYYIQAAGYENAVAADILLDWSWAEPPGPVDISNDTTPWESGNPGAGVNINNVVGVGNSSRLVGLTQTHWASGGFSVPVDLNENTLVIDSGNGNGMNVSGPISGNGTLIFQAGGGNPMHVSGDTGNTYTGTTTISNAIVSLEKTSGDALTSGPITMTSGSSKLTWGASDQINDASDLSLTASGANLNLPGFTDTINDPHLVTGTFVQTGALGVLKVAHLYIDDVLQPEVAYIAGDGYVLGSGYIEVGASGPPVIGDPPAVPASPSPADGSTVHPWALTKIDWNDSSLASSYDVYLVPATDPDPVPGITTPTANVGLSEYTVSTVLDSLTAYKWRIVAKNAAGDTVGPLWTFTTLDRRNISNDTTPWEPANPGAGVNINSVVGGADSAILVGLTQTHWSSGGFSVPLDLNENTLKIDSGNGNGMNVSGPISGNGTLIFQAGGGNPMHVSGDTGNTYTGTTTISNAIVSLEKTSGDALTSGPITMTSGSSKLTWTASDQINDASDVALTASGAMLSLAGFTDTLASLTLTAGATVDTGTDGVLTVTLLTIDGSPMAAGTYTSADGFVAGTGSVVVTSGGGGTTYDDWKVDYAGGGTPAEDFNNDGVQNGVAYFMGENGLATNPGLVGGKVTWPHLNPVASFAVQVSDNLADWVPADPGDVDTTTDPTQVIYTLPTVAPKQFCRLVVTP
ncbi:MAG: hypothetical protein K9N23_21945 [Akkermansiaceae bacterium]|nr:hypothetical protein [Akkermansiaceae bacterium]